MGERTDRESRAEHAEDEHRPEGAPARSRFDRPRQEILMAVVMLAGFVFMRVRIEELVQGRRGAAYLDPDFWPGWLLNVAILLTLFYLAQSVYRAVRAPRATPVAAGTSSAEPTAPDDEPAGTAGELAGDADESALSEEEEEHLHLTRASGNLLMLTMGFVMIFAFIWLMPRIGFIPSAVIFTVGFLLFVGERRWYIVTLLPVGLLGAILYVFTRLLVVPLPRGQGVFVELSTLFY